ncbi:RDD family protein [Pseudomonadota bacterium]
MTEPLQPPSPSLLRRLAAMLYDILLVLPLVMVSVAVVMGLRALLGFGPSAEGIVQLNAQLVQLIAVLTVMAFFSWFWLKNGQTLGMQAWRIKLVGFDGEPPSAKQVIIRCLAAVLSTACLGMGFLWCLVDRRRRYWHDYLSSTELVLLPKKRGNGADQAAESG